MEFDIEKQNLLLDFEGGGDDEAAAAPADKPEEEEKTPSQYAREAKERQMAMNAIRQQRLDQQ